MAKGYIRQKMLVIFKGPWILYWRERGEGRKVVRLMIVLRSLVFEEILQDVKKEHNIEKALKDQDKVEKIAKEIDKESYMLAFNVELELEQVFEIINKIEEAWGRLRTSGKVRSTDEAALLSGLDKYLQEKLIKLEKEQDKEEREIYFQLLEPVIKSAEKSDVKEVMMANVAQMFKTKDDISRWAAIAFRWEARGARRGFKGLKKDLKGVRGIFSAIEKGKGNMKKLANSLREIENRMIAHVKKEFDSTYLLLKRDLLSDLVLLGLLNEDNKEMWEFVQKRLMPRAPELKNAKDLQEIRKEIAEHGRVIAQGLRRLIHKESDLRREAEKELAEADEFKVGPKKERVRVKERELVGAEV